ncbi:TonB-dependent receptor [Hephaestia caeni]|uniref:TonB-dependent receptor n=1 Tax=Hephaestia caeni TaxID=645617 RepID=A0A397NHU6_9SPHN|nr:TonB-dependent receptor [Hephaestia caeni]RIA37106.1 TonB-dependent receptor [Hephaestia caeni]
MKIWRSALLISASTLAASQAFAQAVGQDQADAPAASQASLSGEPAEDAIVVTGIRSSLERAAEVKQNAVQVVDSIVAEDIGKLPDPTTAAALQRVPGVQVSNDRDNELSNVKIRGLSDISTTVDGREVFTTTGRAFDLKDLPAQALKRVDVFKSQTADQIEGGVAGAIDLRLNKPFDFHKPTLVFNVRENYVTRLNRGNPQIGALATDRFDTGIGEIGVLVNATWSHAANERSNSNLGNRRSSAGNPINQGNYLIPEVSRNMPNVGSVTRWQANAALQWQATPSLQAYVDGLYTYFRTTSGFAGFNPSPFVSGKDLTLSNVVATDDCFDARVTAGGTNPNIINNADGTHSLQPFTVQTVCNVKSVRFNNIIINQNSSSIRLTQRNKMVGGGLRYDQDGTKLNFDLAYETSESFNEGINAEAGQRVPWVDVETDVDGGPSFTVGDQYPMNTDLYLRNSFNQNFTLNTGSLIQARLDGEQDFDGILSKIRTGFRFARREAVSQNVQQTNKIGELKQFGPNGCKNQEASQAEACLVSSLGLSPDFIGTIGYAPRLNGGTNFVGPNPAYLRSEEGRNELRALYGLALSQPDYDPTHEFDATETSYATYAMGDYDFPLGSDISLDGTVGVRVIKTDRTISSFRAEDNGDLTKVTAHTSDVDILPSATARVKFPGGFQLRAGYSRTMRRPDFGSLNPVRKLNYVGNPILINNGSQGNPDLKPQKSNSFDASAEYYFHSGFVALTGFYRTIQDRVVSSASQQQIDGENFIISTPRNVGSVKLKGIETSGQYFFDFLPGDLSGLGVLGAFTYVDSEIRGDDPLSGYPLQGVSKYNYTVGGVFDKGGLSARLVYTFRSKYYDGDITGSTNVRPYDQSRPVDDPYLPTLLTYTRPAGRLDFSIGYDVTPQFHIDVGGSNILRNETKTYIGQSFINGEVFGDETTYTIGVRVRL